MKELIGGMESMSGLRFEVILLVVVAFYTSCLVFPSVHNGNTAILAAGIIGTWGILSAAAHRMGSWSALLAPMASHGAFGMVLLVVTAGSVVVTVLAGLCAIGLLPANLFFRS